MNSLIQCECHYYLIITSLLPHYYLIITSLNRKYCRFPLCKWDYIHRTFYSNSAMEQIHWGNILVKRTGRCSCAGCTFQKMFLSPSPKFSWSGLRSCLVTTCLAEHAPFENLRSCDRSMQSPSCADGCLQVMCTWMFSRVGACGSLPARNLYKQN